MKFLKILQLLFVILLVTSCGARKKDNKKTTKDLKTQIEERMIELGCECIESQNEGLTKKEYDDLRDNCLRSSAPAVISEFNITEENNPYGGWVQMLAAFDRVKDGLKEKCPRRE